jgi:catechol 2,3-dioxygenase-like lactoylglutathione lyase family enzyme
MSDSSPSDCFLHCGDDFLALFRADTAGMHHYSYRVDNYDAGQTVERLKAAGLEPRRQGNRVYFEDPDGLTVQISG